MRIRRSERRKVQGPPAVACALLDATAFQLDLKAAAGRRPLVYTPFAIFARLLSKTIAFWTTTWVGSYLGLAWVIRTFQRGKLPPQ